MPGRPSGLLWGAKLYPSSQLQADISVLSSNRIDILTALIEDFDSQYHHILAITAKEATMLALNGQCSRTVLICIGEMSQPAITTPNHLLVERLNCISANTLVGCSLFLNSKVSREYSWASKAVESCPTMQVVKDMIKDIIVYTCCLGGMG